MADWRYFASSFWSDPYIQELKQESKYLYIYLFTNEHCNQAGFYQITVKTISFETGIDKERVSSLLDQFITDGKITYEKHILWVKNFLRHQPNRSPQVWKRIIKDIKTIRDGNEGLVRRYLDHIDTLSIPYPEGIDTLSQGTYVEEEKEEEKEEEERIGEKKAPDDKNHPKPKISLNLETQKFDNITPKDISSWEEAYPACAVESELLKAAQWIISNPTKRKKNYRRFLTNWLARTQERGGARVRGPSASERRLEELKKGGVNEGD